MSTDLAILDPNQMQAAIDYAERLAYSGLVPEVYQGKPANILWAMEYGRTLGLSTIATMNGVNVIKGKPTSSAALISALVRRAGHKMRIGFDAATMTGWAEIVRSDDPDFTFRSEWDLERAVEAELCFIKDGKPFAVDSKGNSLPWKKFFPSMVKARATTEVVRDACEEVVFGLHYTAAELGADVDDDGNPVPVVQQVPERPAQAASQIDDAEVVPEADPFAFWETDEGRHQLTILHTLIDRKYGRKTGEERHASFSRFVRREITSSKQLHPAEVEAYCALLRKQPDLQPAEDEPQEAAPASEQDQADAIEARLLARIDGAMTDAELNEVTSAAHDAAAAQQIGTVHLMAVNDAAAARRQVLLGAAA